MIKHVRTMLGSSLRVLALLIGITWLVSSILLPAWLSTQHLFTILRAVSILCMVSFGQMIVILSGEIDLSVGGTIYFVTVILPLLTRSQIPVWAIIPFGLILGVLVGTVNGIFVGKLKIPSIVQTLGMHLILMGLCWLIGGSIHRRCDPFLITLVSMKIGFIPLIFFILLAVSIFLFFILRNSSLGWKIRAVGSNPEASRLTGLNLVSLRITIFIISGILAGAAGVMYLGWIGRSAYGAGNILVEEYMLQSIAAVIIGGTTFKGGRGGVPQTMLGAFTLVTIFSLLRILGMEPRSRYMIMGLIMLIFVAAHFRARRR